KGFHVIVCNADDNPNKEKTYIDMLRAKQVDGIIAFPTGDNVDLYQDLLNEKYPIIFMDRVVEGIDVQTVLLDNYKAAAYAAEALKDYQLPAVVTPPLKKNVTPRMERLEGIKQEMKNNGRPLSDEYIVSHEMDEREEKLKYLLE